MNLIPFAVKDQDLIEDIRSYWDRQPCNIKYSWAPVGSYAWSNEITERKYKVGYHIPAFAEFPRWKDKRVLEIGCGLGTDTLQFLRYGAYVDAVDLSLESLKLARLRTELHVLNQRARFFDVNAEEYLPGARRYYDLVYSFGVLHHTPNPDAVLKRAFQCLKPGGELRIMLYARWSIKNLIGQQPEAQAGCPLARVTTARETRQMLKRNGFNVISIQKTHIFPYRIKDYVEHRYVKHLCYRYMPKSIFSMLEQCLGWHLLIKARRPF